MTTAAPNITQITQADLDTLFADDQTGCSCPPSDVERFEAWLRLSGYQVLDEAVSLPDFIKS